MKVIFLDVDGVLNTSFTLKNSYYEKVKTGVRPLMIEEAMVERLQKIVFATNAKIVLISFGWRHDFDTGTLNPINEEGVSFTNLFEKYGLSIYDMVPRLATGRGGDEITSWLDDNPVDSFVILEDTVSDKEEYLDYIVKTDYGSYSYSLESECGLLDRHVDEAINCLNRQIFIRK